MRLYLSSSRWYTITLDADLFGHPLLVCRFGGLRNSLPGQHEIPIEPGTLSVTVRTIHKKRIAHGYQSAGKRMP